MKVGDLCRILGALDPDLDLNDLRECATTGADDVEAIKRLLDANADDWDEYAAGLLTKLVIPLLLEQRDLLLMPASGRGWAKPAEMARMVAEQVRLAEERLAGAEAAMKADCERQKEEAAKAAEDARLDCQRREREASEASEAAKAECDELLARARAECESAIADAEEEFRRSLAKLSEQHTLRADQEARRHQEEIARLRKASAKEVKALLDKNAEADHEIIKQQAQLPKRQAAAASVALLKAADTAERLAGLRLSQVSGKVCGLFRNRDLDSAMLRVEADGLKLAAQRLRQMSKEAADQGRWPIEFTPDASEAEHAETPSVAERRRVAEGA